MSEPKAIEEEIAELELTEALPGIPSIVPVMPVRGIVMFPNTMAQLGVQRKMNLTLIDAALPAEKKIVLALEREALDEGPAAFDKLHKVGVLVEVLKLFRHDDDNVGIVLRATHRVSLLEADQEAPYIRARIEVRDTISPDVGDDHWVAAARNLRHSSLRLFELSPNIPPEATQALIEVDTPEELTDFLAANLGMSLDEKQKVLAETKADRRVDFVQAHINNQLHIAELQEKLREDMEEEFTDSQRRAYLRQQLRSIQKELGDGDGSEEQAEELRDKIEAAGLPEDVMEVAQKELKRLDVMPAASPEHGVIVSYLTILSELPWTTMSEDNLDLKRAQKTLDRDHHGLAKVKRRIVEYLAVRKLNPDSQGPILCFLGPPGVGKTSLGQSIADALGRKFARIALGGVRDESEIRGHRRTYIGSMPGRLISELRRTATRNPLIMLDEIDKLGSDMRGDPASALLELLDPRQNHTFTDRYLDVPFDMSQVMFIATANTIGSIPGPLRDRMEIIHIPGYTAGEKFHIATDYLVPRQLKENGLKEKQAIWNDDAIELVISDYTREAGVRTLERQIGSVCRNIAARVAQGGRGRKVTKKLVTEILGAQRFQHEQKLKKSAPGVVTGLAWTPVGGDMLHIEAIKFPGKGQVKLTGQLGDVMKESVQIAHSLVKARAKALKIDPEDFGRFDVHIHVPAGAVPKDGPSAGIAMFTALSSLFSDLKVDRDVAMTGEVTLRGNVLPIGGLKEKSLAALDAGIVKVLIPWGNKADIGELPKEAQEGLEIVPVKTVDHVLKHALVD